MIRKKNTAPLQPGEYFLRQRTLLAFVFLGLIILTGLAGILTKFEIADVFRAVPRVIKWIAANVIPVEMKDNQLIFDQKALSRFPKIMDKLIETVLMSIMATMTAALVSFLVALLGSKTTRLSKPLAAAARGFSSLNRNIPIAAWAMIFLISFGQSPFTGYLALFFYSFGFLSRVFMETIDETSSSTVEALKVVGGSYLQVIAHAVWPSSLPQILSWILYMIETNIRSSTLVGILTGSGIGFLFSVYYKSLQYKSAVLIVLCIIAVVLLLELTSNALRRVIL